MKRFSPLAFTLSLALSLALYGAAMAPILTQSQRLVA